VTLETRCIDRLYLNAYVPRLQSGGGVIDFLVRACGQKIASPAVFGQLTDAFKARLRAWATEQAIPWIEFRKGDRKDTVVQRYRDRFRKPSGVVLIGVAQERASAWSATKQRRSRFVEFVYVRKSVYVNHYYLYLLDPEWGPAFIKICGYAPYAIKICLNGHEWVKRQLSRRRFRFAALDNGFLTCANAAALQQICDTLGPADIEAFFTRWQAVIPLPLTAVHAARGFAYQLSILQAEVSLTQVFDRPLRGREFFETVIRENLDLGRPDHVQLLFPRQIRRNTPGRFATHVVTTGVNPSLHIAYKHCRIKQYFKEERALRTETTFNDTYDFGIGRRLSNLSYLRTLGDHINRRVLETETLAHDCGLAAAQLADLVQPTRTADALSAPALKFGQPRVTALLNGLCHFLWTADGLTNAQLRPLVASLLGTPYTTRQMGYDLRRLVRKGLVKRLDHQKRYVLTPYGRRVSVFLTKVHARVVRPGLQALDLDFIPQTPPLLRTTFTALDRAIDAHIAAAQIAA
ncbi:MAG TPA: hypothetical protein VE714_08080, partial [Gemmatimonadales bacterium]|nr:hypothetical protein [Gemmatimonadales bacterium]